MPPIKTQLTATEKMQATDNLNRFYGKPPYDNSILTNDEKVNLQIELETKYGMPLSCVEIASKYGRYAEPETARQVTTIFEKADLYKGLKEEKERLEANLKDTEAKIKDLGEQMASEMISEELQNFNRQGKCFYVTIKSHFTQVGDKKDDLFAALREHEHGSLIKEHIPAQTFQAFCRELTETEDAGELPDWLVNYVNSFKEQTVGMRKSGK